MGQRKLKLQRYLNHHSLHRRTTDLESDRGAGGDFTSEIKMLTSNNSTVPTLNNVRFNVLNAAGKCKQNSL